jgi:hypothetical protein
LVAPLYANKSTGRFTNQRSSSRRRRRRRRRRRSRKRNSEKREVERERAKGEERKKSYQPFVRKKIGARGRNERESERV